MRLHPSRTGISVVLPAFREQESIARVVQENVSWLDKKGWGYEVIVVDDGSDDDTSLCAQELCRRLPQVRLLRHERNTGYGAALRTGITAAKYPLVLMMDADGQCPIENLEALAARLETHDAVVGMRLQRKDGVSRLLISKGYNCLLRLLFGLPNTDVNCPMKLFARADLLRLPLRCNRFFAPAELLLLASEAGLLVAECPIRHIPRLAGKTTVSLWQTTMLVGELLRHLVRPVHGTMRMPTDDTFESWNECYASRFDHDAYFSSENAGIRWVGKGRMRAMLRPLRLTPEQRVLDVGCGDGGMLRMLPACHKTGIDLSKTALDLARKNTAGTCDLQRMNAEVMTFPNASFDAVICSEVLEHTMHPKRVMEEISRVLAPGGTAVVSIPHERAIKLAKRWCVRLCGAKGIRMNADRTLMPVQNPWHLHDANMRLLQSWIPDALTVRRVEAIPTRLLPLHYVVTLRHRR